MTANKNELVILTGSTARITCQFYDFSDKLKDPTVVKFVTYDSKYNVIEQVTLGIENKLSEGVYFFDYKAPNEAGKRYYYEFYGEVSGNPSLDRGVMRTIFV